MIAATTTIATTIPAMAESDKPGGLDLPPIQTTHRPTQSTNRIERINGSAAPSFVKEYKVKEYKNFYRKRLTSGNLS